ncbi:phospholipase [Niastella yeongjuensis]|uniref:phospholipase D n=1 Tax=Niastella yeongjuensis TaxID=354355 RepID=A0A1V9E1T4_9BACT|nr:phospholipase D-like domain-containing protein [Niastella yeongjuensis]OQP40039.1 phospholipase [Niastella yeongjuensis]SEO14449.1 Phosphatidylserine/phosphatidylglycerophosphate/cardiolipin synthase [Niastella yeongjuensis]
MLVNVSGSTPAPFDDQDNLEQAIAAIKAEGAQYVKAPVIGLRPGFSQLDTNNPYPVIVAVVQPGATVTGLPVQINGVPVEIRKASVQDLVEGVEPIRFWEDVQTEAAPHINYTPPDPSPLDSKKIPVKNITCHVGPDRGWKMLKPFLEGTEKSLTVAMYEFYAEHILETVKKLGEETEATLDLILQVDKNDADCEEQLRGSWGDRLKFVKASVKGPQRLFNNSYHTKVAVRDSKDMWLSSGNWSPNSQPIIAPGSDQVIYRNGNREWHVIIKDKKLAALYEEMIKFDMDAASNIPEPEAAQLLPDLLVPESFFQPEAVLIQPHPFEPKDFAANGESIDVVPLMSPDNYADGILDLISKAKTSVFLQFSYINKPAEKFDEIITAVGEKMQAGLDVRVIVGTSQKPVNSDFLIAKRKWKRKMFKIQKSKLHNKGVIIDGKIAVVGSNNWSSDGTQYNRDSSLIFYSRDIAKYYTEVFEFDWFNQTRPINTEPAITPELAPATGPTPPGMVRIPWQTWFTE